MPTIMCTLDTWRCLGQDGSPPVRVATYDDEFRLGDWSAKVVDEPHGRFCLALNEKTYLTILFPFVGLPQFHQAFASAVELELVHLGVSASVVALETELLLQCSAFAKNTNRSLVGSLNDVARCFKSELDMAGSADSGTLLAIQHEFNMMPHVGQEEPFPAYAVAQLFARGSDSRAV